MLTNKSILTILLFLAPFWVLAQSIKGTVIDDQGNPLPFATIYVYETGSGSITNENGRYEIKLDPGTYNIAFQYLGYQSQKIKVEMGSATIQKDIVMPAQAYLLNVAQVKGGKEDPAYTVIRKAIAKSSYHRQQVEKYTCEVYVKGGGKLVSVPWFLENALEEEGIDTSLTFVTESVSEITYTRPGNYEEKVISIRSTGDSRNTNPMQYINSSFYDPKVGGIVSPLSPKAFGYYKFKYVRTFEERGYQINEIKVIPRSVGEDVVSGSLFIVEDLWCLHSLNLKTTTQGIEVNLNQMYAPIAETAWMPVSHVFKGSGKIFGVGFEFQYLATGSKYVVELNKDLEVEFVLLDEKTDIEEVEELKERKKSKSEADIEAAETKLQEGEELTRKDLRKLLRSYEKETRKQEDEPEVMETRKMSIDSLAYKSDSTYWALKRPIPLTSSESKGYTYQDSMVVEAEKRAEGDTLGIGSQKFRAKDLLLGSRYDLGNDNYLRIVPAWFGIQFNTVDGWNAEYELKYLKRFDRTKRLEINPLIRYAFKREKVSWNVNSEYKYGSGLHTGSISFNGGQYYSQFNQNNPISPMFNTYTSLFVEDNYMKVYDRNYGEVNWGHEITHNIKINADASYAERAETFNNTSQTWFPDDNKQYTSNAPENIEMPNTSFGRSVAFKTKLGFEWQPGLKHNKSGDNYYPINNPPKIIVDFEKAIPGVVDSEIDYELITAELQYTLDFNLLGKLGFSTKAGKFLSSKNMDFPDFQHFQGNQTILTRTAQMAGYAMLPYYDNSTSDEFVRTYVNYEFRQFLLTSIPVIRLMGIKENINVNHLYTPTMNNYMEVGYSVDNIFRFVRLDFTANFIDGKYEDFVFQIGITSDIIQFE